jgi:hypothetical protein
MATGSGNSSTYFKFLKIIDSSQLPVAHIWLTFGSFPTFELKSHRKN